MEIPTHKICTKCGPPAQPLKDFAKDKRRPDGTSSRCLTCTATRARELHGLNRESRLAQRKQERAKQKVSGYTRVRNAAYHARKAARHQERRVEDLEGLKVIWQRAGKTYREKHPERIRIRNKDPRIKAWHKAHPEHGVAQQERRRARKRGLPDTWTPNQRAYMFEYWQHSCAICGNPKGLFWTLAMDHWIPLTAPHCPGTVASNMLPLCHGNDGCNNSKHASDPHAWLVKRFGTKKAAKIEGVINTYFAEVTRLFM